MSFIFPCDLLKHSSVELSSVHDLCGFLGFRVFLACYSHLFYDFFCREFSKFRRFYKGNQFDLAQVFSYPVIFQVSIIKVAKGQVVKGRMGRHAHYYSASVLRPDKRSRKRNYLVVGYRVCEFYSYYGFCRYVLNIFDCPVRKGEFSESFPAYNPELCVSIFFNSCLYITNVRIDPEVCHSECCFRPQGCTGKNQVFVPELDQGVFYDCGFFPVEYVVVFYRIVIVRAPFYRV